MWTNDLNGEIVFLWSFPYFLTRIKFGLNKNCDIIRILILGGCIAVDCGGTSHPITHLSNYKTIYSCSGESTPLEGINKYGKKRGEASNVYILDNQKIHCIFPMCLLLYYICFVLDGECWHGFFMFLNVHWEICLYVGR